METGAKKLGCEFCAKDAVYMCNVCHRQLCGEHVRLRTLCSFCAGGSKLEYTVQELRSEEEREGIRRLVGRFWGEEDQLTFDRGFTVAELPGYVAKVEDTIVGFVSFAETDGAIIVVALGVLPRFQGSGVGKRLVEEVENCARRRGKERLLVSTSNDDLPALAFYQSLGFQIFEVKPDIIAEKHGSLMKGIGGLPVRDELRLRKNLNWN